MCQTPNVETGFHVCVLSKVPCTKENDKKMCFIFGLEIV